MNKRGLLDPTPELPDDTLIGDVRFATRIRNALNAAGLKTVGDVRETSDEILLSFQDLGPGSVAHLRRYAAFLPDFRPQLPPSWGRFLGQRGNTGAVAIGATDLPRFIASAATRLT